MFVLAAVINCFWTISSEIEGSYSVSLSETFYQETYKTVRSIPPSTSVKTVNRAGLTSYRYRSTSYNGFGMGMGKVGSNWK